MKKKLVMIGNLILILILIYILFSVRNKTYAAEQSYYLGLTNIRQDKGAYEIASKGAGTRKKIWKIVSYSSQSDNNISYKNAFYCLRAELGFGLTNGNQNVTTEKRQYNVKHDMKTEKN